MSYKSLKDKKSSNEENKTPMPLKSTKKNSASKKSKLANNLPHVLIVEDNTVALKVLEKLIIESGYRFTSARNGEEALELAKAADFDLVITDIGLPGMWGNELAQRIREWELTLHRKPIPIIGLTAHALKKEGKNNFQSAMDKVLTKPANLKTIQAVVEEFVLKDAGSLFNQQDNQPGKLGMDLPDETEELFNLEQYPLLDPAAGIKTFGSDAVLSTLLQMMAATSIPNDEVILKQAHAAGNWSEIIKLAHKIKGGALYCGTLRLRYACQYLERYHKAGHETLLIKLYQQLMQVLADTKDYIDDWLKHLK